MRWYKAEVTWLPLNMERIRAWFTELSGCATRNLWTPTKGGVTWLMLDNPRHRQKRGDL